MTQQSSLVLANKFTTNDIGHAHAQMVQRHFASDLSALLNCNVDIIYIKTIDETEKRLVLTESEKQYLVLESRKKFSTIMKSFPRPGRLKIIFGSPAMEISKSIKADNTVEALIMGGSEKKIYASRAYRRRCNDFGNRQNISPGISLRSTIHRRRLLTSS